jgi:hypothetical protein
VLSASIPKNCPKLDAIEESGVKTLEAEPIVSAPVRPDQVLIDPLVDVAGPANIFILLSSLL